MRKMSINLLVKMVLKMESANKIIRCLLMMSYEVYSPLPLN